MNKKQQSTGTPKIEFSNSESEEDDTVPIGKLLGMKKTEQLTGIATPKLSPLSPCTRNVVGSSKGQIVEELVTPPRRRRRRLLSQRQCVEELVTLPRRRRRRLLSRSQWEETKSRVDQTSVYENRSSNNVKTGASSQEEVCDRDETAENDEELVSEESTDPSESEGESLGGFIVPDEECSERGDNSCESSGSGDGYSDTEGIVPDEECSERGDNSCESSGSGDGYSDTEGTVDSALEYRQTMESLGSRRPKDSEWRYESDMLADFGKDPILCLKAVCAIYRRQTAEEKSIKGTLHHNMRGFKMCHAYRGSQIAEFLTDGSPEGDVVKSLEELDMFDPDGIEYCRKLAGEYSKQLFDIYQNNEDPLFHPF